MSADADVLIHRYLEGALDADGAAALEEALRRDPEARRRLAEMAFDHLELRDLVRTAPAAGRRRPAWAPALGAAAIILAAAGAALLVPRGAEPPHSPAASGTDYRGFAGRLKGTVLTRTEASVRLKVTEVPGRPGHPLTGTTAVIVPGFARGDGGEVGGPHKLHQAFLRRLEPGTAAEIDVRHAGDDLFLVGELTEAQAASLKDKRKDPARREREGGDKDEGKKEEDR